MIRENPNADFPKIHKTAYVDPTALVIGKVNIGKDVFVEPQAVIKANEPKSSIVIKDNCNIQDRGLEVIIAAAGGAAHLAGR